MDLFNHGYSPDILDNVILSLYAEHVAQRIADFPQGGVGFHAIEESRHGIPGALSHLPEVFQRRRARK